MCLAPASALPSSAFLLKFWHEGKKALEDIAASSRRQGPDGAGWRRPAGLPGMREPVRQLSQGGLCLLQVIAPRATHLAVSASSAPPAAVQGLSSGVSSCLFRFYFLLPEKHLHKTYSVPDGILSIV